MTILLLRHCQTDWNLRAGPLPGLGRGRAQRDRPRPGARVRSRARRARPRADRHQPPAARPRDRRRSSARSSAARLPVIADPRFAETHRGEWEQRLFSEIVDGGRRHVAPLPRAPRDVPLSRRREPRRPAAPRARGAARRGPRRPPRPDRHARRLHPPGPRVPERPRHRRLPRLRHRRTAASTRCRTTASWSASAPPSPRRRRRPAPDREARRLVLRTRRACVQGEVGDHHLTACRRARAPSRRATRPTPRGILPARALTPSPPAAVNPDDNEPFALSPEDEGPGVPDRLAPGGQSLDAAEGLSGREPGGSGGPAAAGEPAFDAPAAGGRPRRTGPRAVRPQEARHPRPARDRPGHQGRQDLLVPARRSSSWPSS